MKARRQQNDLAGGNGQLARELALALLGLGVGTGGVATDTDNIASADVDVLLLEAGNILGNVVGLSEDLESGALERVSMDGVAWLIVSHTLERRS